MKQNKIKQRKKLEFIDEIEIHISVAYYCFIVDEIIYFDLSRIPKKKTTMIKIFEKKNKSVVCFWTDEICRKKIFYNLVYDIMLHDSTCFAGCSIVTCSHTFGT